MNLHNDETLATSTKRLLAYSYFTLSLAYYWDNSGIVDGLECIQNSNHQRY